VTRIRVPEVPRRDLYLLHDPRTIPGVGEHSRDAEKAHVIAIRSAATAAKKMYSIRGPRARGKPLKAATTPDATRCSALSRTRAKEIEATRARHREGRNMRHPRACRGYGRECPCENPMRVDDPPRPCRSCPARSGAQQRRFSVPLFTTTMVVPVSTRKQDRRFLSPLIALS